LKWRSPKKEKIRGLIKEVQYIKFMEKQYEILDNEKEWVSIDEI